MQRPKTYVIVAVKVVVGDKVWKDHPTIARRVRIAGYED
jgi:hypothetical protein